MPRRRNSKLKGRFTVGDHPGYPSAGAALSYAQNLALHSKEACTHYVRDLLGNTIYRVERTEDGVVFTTTVGAE